MCQYFEITNEEHCSHKKKKKAKVVIKILSIFLLIVNVPDKGSKIARNKCRYLLRENSAGYVNIEICIGLPTFTKQLCDSNYIV